MPAAAVPEPPWATGTWADTVWEDGTWGVSALVSLDPVIPRTLVRLQATRTLVRLQPDRTLEYTP